MLVASKDGWPHLLSLPASVQMASSRTADSNMHHHHNFPTIYELIICISSSLRYRGGGVWVGGDTSSKGILFSPLLFCAPARFPEIF